MTPNPRTAMFAACRALGMDDDTRRAMIQMVTGKASSKDLTGAEWTRVLDHLNSKTGHISPQKRGRKPAVPTQDKAALMRKIEAQLADMHLPWGYITSSKTGKSMCQRLAGVDALEFADPRGLGKIVAALAYRQKKIAA